MARETSMQGKLSPVILVTDQSTTDQSPPGKSDVPLSSYVFVSLLVIIPILLVHEIRYRNYIKRRRNAIASQAVKPSNDAPDDIKLDACKFNMLTQGRIRGYEAVRELTYADIAKCKSAFKRHWEY